MADTTELDDLLSNLPGFALLTAGMKEKALAGALIPDANGVWPGQPGYLETVDTYFAAIGMVGFLRAQPVVRQASSEGTATAVDAPNWEGLVAWFQSLSPIVAATGSSVINKVLIPEGPHVVKVDMRGGDNGYDNVDTDLG